MHIAHRCSRRVHPDKTGYHDLKFTSARENAQARRRPTLPAKGFLNECPHMGNR